MTSDPNYILGHFGNKFSSEKNKKLFIKFLKENHAYENFMFNFNNREKYLGYRKRTFNNFISFALYNALIYSAFNWFGTSEGYEYWHVLDRQWCLYYDSL